MTRVPLPAPLTLAAALLAAALLASPAAAQGFNMSRAADTQIQVYADNGIEWQSDALRVIAHGNAKAVRGTMTVTADTLTAYYRKGPNGDEIWRLDADGAVTIASPNETATGVKATYDLDKAIFVLRGSPARMVTPTESFSASETLEYWELKHMAVIRGNAVATQEDKKIQADVLTAHFKDKSEGVPAAGKPGAKPAAKGSGGSKDGGSLELRRADAYGNVVLTTAAEVVTGDRGEYNVETGIATVLGSVKITRDGNVLNGGFAHVNLNTGISKLFASVPGAPEQGQRVQGTFMPEKGEKSDKGAAPQRRTDDGERRAVFTGNAPNPDAARGAERR